MTKFLYLLLHFVKELLQKVILCQFFLKTLLIKLNIFRKLFKYAQKIVFDFSKTCQTVLNVFVDGRICLGRLMAYELQIKTSRIRSGGRVFGLKKKK